VSNVYMGPGGLNFNPVAQEPEGEPVFVKVSANDNQKTRRGDKGGLVRASDVIPRPVYWLWRPYIPKGMVTLISGDPGLGKSQATLALAAAVSAGRPLPGITKARAPMRVLIYNAEDALEEVLKPRLMAAGANMDNVAIRQFIEGDFLMTLEADLKGERPGLAIIDPMVAYLRAEIDMNKANDVRGFMAVLSKLAEKYGVAILPVRHLRKSGRGDSGKAIYAGLGSIDFTGAARSELLFEKAKLGDRLVRHIKNNVAPLGPTLSYEVIPATVSHSGGPMIETSRIEWLGLYEGTEGDSEPLFQPQGGTKVGEAKAFLLTFLASGPVPANDIVKLAEAEKINLYTLRDAKKGIAEAVRCGPVWCWQLCPAAGQDGVGLTV
jgi:hypothetical protein